MCLIQTNSGLITRFQAVIHVLLLINLENRIKLKYNKVKELIFSFPNLEKKSIFNFNSIYLFDCSLVTK